MSHVNEQSYSRLVVCWFKAVLTSDQNCKTEKLRRMMHLYPAELAQARIELFKK